MVSSRTNYRWQGLKNIWQRVRSDTLLLKRKVTRWHNLQCHPARGCSSGVNQQTKWTGVSMTTMTPYDIYVVGSWHNRYLIYYVFKKQRNVLMLLQWFNSDKKIWHSIHLLIFLYRSIHNPSQFKSRLCNHEIHVSSSLIVGKECLYTLLEMLHFMALEN